MNKNVPIFAAVVLALAMGGCAQAPATDAEGGTDNVAPVDSKKAADANAELGLRYMLQGKYDIAMEKLRRALSYDSHSLEANHYIAELYRRVGKFEEADQHFRRALAEETSENPVPALHQNYGAFLCGQKRYEEAEKQFQKVLENPVYTARTQVLENLGLCFMEKDRSKAEGYLRQVLTIDPRSPKSLYGMAEVSFSQQNYTSARAFLQRYSEVARPTPDALWLGVRVERALGDKNAEKSYGMMLKNWFPDSTQTREYLKSGNP